MICVNIDIKGHIFHGHYLFRETSACKKGLVVLQRGLRYTMTNGVSEVKRSVLVRVCLHDFAQISVSAQTVPFSRRSSMFGVHCNNSPSLPPSSPSVSSDAAACCTYLYLFWSHVMLNIKVF